MNSSDTHTSDGFNHLAARATDGLTFDASRTLAAVRTQHRQRTLRRRRAMIGVPAVAALAIGGLGAQAFLVPDSIPAAQAYEFGDTDVEPIAELTADLTVGYLPDAFDGDLALDYAAPATDNGAGAVNYATSCYTGETSNQVTICVSTADDLTVAGYVENYWFQGEKTEVNGTPALINAVTSDGAGGILFSPEVGTVVEIHVSSDLSGDLREIVANMALTRG